MVTVYCPVFSPPFTSNTVTACACVQTLSIYPIDGTLCKTLIGAVDYSFLFTYALVMIVRLVCHAVLCVLYWIVLSGSGVVADRVSLRYFLTAGMFGRYTHWMSCVCVCVCVCPSNVVCLLYPRKWAVCGATGHGLLLGDS